MQGLVVTISPTQSAFFAGEQFCATITFTNPNPPTSPSSSKLTSPYNNQINPKNRSIPQSAFVSNSSDWKKVQDETIQNELDNNNNNNNKNRRSSSNGSIAEYSTSYLDTEDFPPSPLFNNSPNQSNQSTPNPNLSSSINSNRESIISTSNGGALPTPHSASFGPLPHLRAKDNTIRSASTNALASTSNSNSKSKSTPILPTRKGLIGKPLRTSISALNNNDESATIRRSSAGIYGGARRPGGALGGGHNRAQSMAVSNPDLTNRSSSSSDGFQSMRNNTPPTSAGSVRSHGKSRLGGSLGGEALASLLELQRRESGIEVPPSITEEEYSPSFASPPTNQNQSLELSSPPQKIIRRPLPTPPTNRNQNYSSTSSVSLNNSNGSHPSDSSLVLHDIDEENQENGVTNGGDSFYGLRNDTMESLVRDDLDEQARIRELEENGSTSTIAQYAEETEVEDQNNVDDPYPEYRPAHIPPPRSAPLPRTRNSLSTNNALNAFLHPPNTLTLLWSFAHLEGTFEVEEALIKPTEFNQVKSGLLSPLVPGSGMGGGTLDPSAGNVGGGGWRDWIWGSPSIGTLNSGNAGLNNGISRAVVGAATLEERKKERMRDKSIPTFSCPRSILGVDLVLEPGQSKSYTFSIRIPADLPPSFRGKSIKFSYNLVVGTNRASFSGNLRGAARDSLSRVMKVPVRVYNHVAVTGARPFYDLTNPIVYHRDEAVTRGVDDLKVTKRSSKPDNGRKDFEAYATTLLDSVVHNAHNAPGGYIPSDEDRLTPIIMESTPDLRPEMRSRTGSLIVSDKINLDGAVGIGVEEEGVGCKSAVEIVSRNSQKVSYDINKDGFMVASLTLVKSAYRLGETVNGSVVVNSGDGRVLRVSARLETHELIETSISTKTAPQIRQITRRLHSEYHETTLDSARVGFALAIPSGATPDFATSGVKLQWSVRLSFLVIPPSPDSPLPPLKKTRATSAGTAPLPTSSRHGRSKSFAYGFEPSVPLTLPAAPSILPTGATHLMPVLGPLDTSLAHISYRAVPDLGFVPVLFSSNVAEGPAPPGPLQRSASGASHKASPSLSSMRAFSSPVIPQNSVVLVPAKIETVECSIPIKVYPGNTPFRPSVQVFAA